MDILDGHSTCVKRDVYVENKHIDILQWYQSHDTII